MVMPIIKISNFDGPFNLLLHLIKKNEMNINQIRIEEIIKQYLDYINIMKELDLEITSEFIVMAATLIEIKSKTLLPKEQKEEEEEDPTKELLIKLNEYKKFKLIAEYFKSKDLDAGTSFTKKPEIIEEVEIVDNYNYLKNTTMLDLYSLYNKLMRLYNDKQNHGTVIEKKIKADQYKIKDKIKLIQNSIKLKAIVNFSDIIITCECKLEVVVAFLALLEMIKNNEITIIQNNNFDEIIIERNTKFE